MIIDEELYFHYEIEYFLEHHGVKGMHWGVTTEDTTMSKEQRKEARKNVRNFAIQTTLIKYSDGFERPITNTQYKNLSTKNDILNKGKLFTRITMLKNDKLKDFTFVSYKPNDINTYTGTLPVIASPFKFGGNKRYKSSYEVTYKALETLKSPSEKERVDAFISIIDTPSIVKRNGKVITGREFLKSSFPVLSRTLDSQQLGLRLYNSFTSTLGSNSKMNTPINSAYFKKLQKKGYNYLSDDNDKGSYAEAPLIILNPNGSLKKISTKALTADDINKAQLQLKLPPKVIHTNIDKKNKRRSMEFNEFLEHYGVTGMKKPATPQKLDRLYRIVSGTEIKKNKIQKALKLSAKELEKEVSAKEAPPPPVDNNKPGEISISNLLLKVGSTRVSDIGSKVK